MTLRCAVTLRHLGVGRAWRWTPVMLLVEDCLMRVLSAQGEFVAEFETDPTRGYQARRI